jgi:hypothetical protein
LQALKWDVYERIGQKEQAACGVGRVQLCNVVFNGTLKSYEDQIPKWGLTKVVVYEWLLDPVNAQCLPRSLTQFTEDHTTQAILTLCPLQGGDPHCTSFDAKNSVFVDARLTLRLLPGVKQKMG